MVSISAVREAERVPGRSSSSGLIPPEKKPRDPGLFPPEKKPRDPGLFPPGKKKLAAGLLAIVGTLGCSGGGDSDAVARALAEQPEFVAAVAEAVAWAPAASATRPDSTPPEPAVRRLLVSPCLGDAELASADRTLELLLELGALMEDVGSPPLPPDESATECLTAIARRNHPELVAGERASIAAAVEARRDAREAAGAAPAAWEQSRDTDWTWDPAWATVRHVPEQNFPRVMGCRGLGDQNRSERGRVSRAARR